MEKEKISELFMKGIDCSHLHYCSKNISIFSKNPSLR